MKLFYSLASPYARKIRILLRELAINCDEVLVDTKDNEPGFIQANPLGKVPVLQINSDLSLFDSQVIASYLMETGDRSGTQILGWQDQLILSAIQGMTDQAVTMILEKRRPEPLRYDYWLDRYRQAIPRSLTWLWQQNSEALRSPQSLASISLGCLLQYLSFRHNEVSWGDHSTELNQWLEPMQQRSAFLATMPK